jgi:hypothetical protein
VKELKTVKKAARNIFECWIDDLRKKSYTYNNINPDLFSDLILDRSKRTWLESDLEMRNFYSKRISKQQN